MDMIDNLIIELCNIGTKIISLALIGPIHLTLSYCCPGPALLNLALSLNFCMVFLFTGWMFHKLQWTTAFFWALA